MNTHPIPVFLTSLLATGLACGCAGDREELVETTAALLAGEPTLAYSTTRPPETQSYAQLATLVLRITDQPTIDYLDRSPTAQYTLTYQRLSDGSSPDLVTPLETIAIGFATWRPPLFPLPLSLPFPGPTRSPKVLFLNPNSPGRGLLPLTVYRMKVQLFDAAGSALGPSSSWFYVVTGGTTSAPSTTLKLGRIDIVLQALNQLGDSQDGLIGLDGTVAPNGSRFTGSSMTPLHPSYHVWDDFLWCDWFYRYLGIEVTDGLDGSRALNPVVDGGTLFWKTTMDPNHVPNAFRDPLADGCGTEIGDPNGNGIANEVIVAGCQSFAPGQVTLDLNDNQFYSNISTDVYYDAIKSLPSNQGIGNYQAMDSHAGMFLAFDPNGDGSFSGAGTIGTVWSIEGNVGNHVAIMHRPSDSTVINGFGKLTSAMFSP